MHTVEARSSAIDSAEFAQAVNAVESGNLDGVVVFVWSDLLKIALLDKDTTRIDALRFAIQYRASQSTRK
jgi:hypothetical protein